jgi:hypothetical protein
MLATSPQLDLASAACARENAGARMIWGRSILLSIRDLARIAMSFTAAAFVSAAHVRRICLTSVT